MHVKPLVGAVIFEPGENAPIAVVMIEQPGAELALSRVDGSEEIEAPIVGSRFDAAPPPVSPAAKAARKRGEARRHRQWSPSRGRKPALLRQRHQRA